MPSDAVAVARSADPSMAQPADLAPQLGSDSAAIVDTMALGLEPENLHLIPEIVSSVVEISQSDPGLVDQVLAASDDIGGPLLRRAMEQALMTGQVGN